MKRHKLGIYNAKELRSCLGLDIPTFNKLMLLEVERYRRMVSNNYNKAYYIAKVEEDPTVAKYGGTPTFMSHPMYTPSYIFNNDSGVWLEKTWSTASKYNSGKSLPFNFVFKPTKTDDNKPLN